MTYNCPVAQDIPKAPYIKPKNFLFHLLKVVTDGIPKYADSIRDPSVAGTIEHENFWNSEISKIVNGFWIKDIWIPGRFYYYMNYKHMSTIKGVITPDMVDLHLELAYHIEYCLANGKNLLCAKGRRKGISEAVSTMVVDYGWRFSEGFKAGVAAGNKTYVEDFVAKWRFSDSRLPPELSTKKLTDNDDEIIAGYQIKNQHNVYEEKGTFNTIYARTMHNNPNMFKGLYLNVVISEEIGEHENWVEFFGATKDCLMSGTQQAGILIGFGTAGNVNKGSKDFKKIWQDPDTYNFVRFMIPADRFLLYGNAKNAYQRIPSESELFKKYNEYQLIGVEDREISLKTIVERRAKLLKQGNLKEYNEDLQNNPINEYEMFRKTVVNNFNINKLNEQQARIDQLPQPKWTKYKLDWVKDDKGMIKMPLQVEAKVLMPHENQDECIWIIDGEFPRKGFLHLTTAGCLLPGEKVMTQNGLVSVEDVKITDCLINKEGQYVSINALMRHEVVQENVYKVKVSNTFRTTTFTKEHPLLTSKPILRQYYRTDGVKYKFNESYWDLDFSFNKAEDVCVGDWIKVPNIYIKENDFNISKFWSKDIRTDFIIKSPLYNPDFWWIVGLWLGDGWLDDKGKKNKIYVSFNEKEAYFVRKYKDVIKSVFGRSVSTRTRNGSTETSFTSKQLCDFLSKNFGKYAIGKKIPEWAKHINKTCKKELVRGYLNSDGSIGIDKKRSLYNTQFISINLGLVEAIQDILFSLGYISNICKLRSAKEVKFNKNSVKTSKILECYQLRLGHNHTLELVKDLWDSEDHKLKKVDFSNLKINNRRRPNDGCFIDKSGEYIYFQIREMEKSVYTGSVYNFDCETHTFMCHHITTHNCDSYDQDTAKASKSLGAMCIRIRGNNAQGAMRNAPIAVINCRPRRKEIFYDLCLKAAVFYNLESNVLVDVGAGLIMQHFKENGGWKYLADRPRKFESENSEQTHEKGIRLTTFSRPRMGSVMQSDIEDNVENNWFGELVNQLGNYDEIEIGSDNDLADAYGLAILQDLAFEVRPRDESLNDVPDRFDIPEFVSDGNGGVRLKSAGSNQVLRHPQQDRDSWDLMFGSDRT